MDNNARPNPRLIHSHRSRVLKNKKYSIRNMFIKATWSAAIGFPISMCLNLVLQNYMAWSIKEYPGLVAAILIGIPYFITSQWRQFIIDWVYQAKNIIIDPKHLLEALYKKYKENKNVRLDKKEDKNTS